MEVQNYQEETVDDVMAETKSNLNGLSEEIKNNDKYVENYMQNILKKAQDIAKRKYTYGTGKHQFVCDTFVKKVLSSVGNKTFEGVYATPNMYKKEKPTDTLDIGDDGKLKTPDIVPGSVLFFVDKKDFCGHVAIFAGNKNGHPQVYDATQRLGVSKRTLSPAEAAKIYYKTIL